MEKIAASLNIIANSIMAYQIPKNNNAQLINNTPDEKGK